MSAYGKAAILAVENFTRTSNRDPRAAWVIAVAKVFPSSVSLREKGCPRGAFLGLCEEGLVRGIPQANYTRSKLNKKYAVRALRLIFNEPSLADDIRKLWRRVVGTKSKAHNQQMNVVVALWNAGLTVH